MDVADRVLDAPDGVGAAAGLTRTGALPRSGEHGWSTIEPSHGGEALLEHAPHDGVGPSRAPVDQSAASVAMVALNVRTVRSYD
ncbi:MAG: hypothetical protein LC799_15875 [Actinobacteria bacterium]|nr:hypothetical protein [Actinomycetota bacterium]